MLALPHDVSRQSSQAERQLAAEKKERAQKDKQSAKRQQYAPQLAKRFHVPGRLIRKSV